jgi:hypothetical protein
VFTALWSSRGYFSADFVFGSAEWRLLVRRYFGAMPFPVSSLNAFSFFDRCANPIPRRTFGALVNWMLS